VVSSEDKGIQSGSPRGSDSLFRVGLATSVALVLTSAAFVASAVLLLTWFAVGRPRLEHVDGVSLGAALDALKFSGGIVLGVGGAVALVVAYRRQRLGEAEHRRQGEASERDRTRLYNERFARASDQPGSDRPAIRLAGIYAMAGLADDWDDGRQTCIDVLCAYLRMPFCPHDPIPSYERSPHQRPRPWEKPGEPRGGSEKLSDRNIEQLRHRGLGRADRFSKACGSRPHPHGRVPVRS
jgi:hypothetical protein